MAARHASNTPSTAAPCLFSTPAPPVFARPSMPSSGHDQLLQQACRPWVCFKTPVSLPQTGPGDLPLSTNLGLSGGPAAPRSSTATGGVVRLTSPSLRCHRLGLGPARRESSPAAWLTWPGRPPTTGVVLSLLRWTTDPQMCRQVVLGVCGQQHARDLSGDG